MRQLAVEQQFSVSERGIDAVQVISERGTKAGLVTHCSIRSYKTILFGLFLAS